MQLQAVPADVAYRLEWNLAEHSATVTPSSAESPYVSDDSTVRHAGAQQCMHSAGRRSPTLKERASYGWVHDRTSSALFSVPRSVPEDSNQPATLMTLLLDRCIADVLRIGKNVSCVLLPPWRAGRTP